MKTMIFNQEKIIKQIEAKTLSSIEGARALKKILEFRKTLFFCRTRWVKTKIHSGAKPEGTLVLFDENKSLYNSFCSSYCKTENLRVILVKAGKHFSEEENGVFTINPSHEQSFGKLLESFKVKNIVPDFIVYSRGNEEFPIDQHQIEKQLDKGIYSLFYFIKNGVAHQYFKQAKIIFLAKNPIPNPLYSSLGGFLKTVNREHAGIKLKLIDFDDKIGTENLLQKVLDELGDTGFEESEIQYDEDAVRSVRKIVENRQRTNQPLYFKEHGVYIITGGLGALGLIFSKYLAFHYKAKLVLCGRSGLNGDKQSAIDELQDLGAEVIYQKVDLSSPENVLRLIRETKDKFGPVNGIIHSAGQIADNYIIKKTKDQIESVLQPKIYGTINLDVATKDETLDFFIVFSSIASLKGNIGQCDYAYANSFLDNFMAYREQLVQQNKRKGKSIAISWPLWHEGGMHVDEPTGKYIMNTMGLIPLETDKGIFALEEVFRLQGTQTIVLEGDNDKLKKYFGISENETSEEKQSFNTEPGEHNPDEYLQLLQKNLVGHISAISKVDVKLIDVDTEISDYGFDSISFTELTNVINDTYNTGVTPAIFFEYPTVVTFAPYLMREYKHEIYSYFGIENGTVSPTRPEIKELGVKHTIKQQKKRHYPASPKTENYLHEPVAIIGMSGVMPQSENLDEFWDHLEAGTDLIDIVPTERWDWKLYHGDPAKEKNKTKSRWGGFISDVASFDNKFFGISPSEAGLMDPQQRLFIETVWKTIEDAGYRATELNDTKTGVFVGVSTSDYDKLLLEEGGEIDAYNSTGLAHSVLANRVSYLFNWHGPSEPIDTACSSSLIAVHRAVESIQNKRCGMAIAGGVNLLLHPYLYLSFSKAGMLSEDGRCKTFDKNANGYVRGEGVGAVFLKPLKEAIKDKDRIYAVIKGSSENHGGRANTLTAPNPNAQADLLIDAYTRADVDPTTVSYIEVHGTGTPLGDPIEVNALKKAFKYLQEKQGHDWGTPFCGLSSVKSNIGHLESAAGIAGLIKTILSVRNKKIPASLHVSELNPYIELTGSPFYIVSKTKDWEQQTDKNNIAVPRRAGVSSFGFGGANAHIILEEFIDENTTDAQTDTSGKSYIVGLSAKSEERLKFYASAYIQFLERKGSENPKENNRYEKIEGPIRDLASQVLNIGSTSIDAMEDFEQLGFDLVKYNELTSLLEEQYGLKVPVHIYSEHRSIARLSSYLIGHAPHAFNKATNTDRLESPGNKEGNENGLFIGDLSYTSLVGREEFDERLALIVSNIGELKDKLERFLAGESAVDGVYSNFGKSREVNLNALINNDEGNDFVRKVIVRKDLHKLARLWVYGVEIRWKSLFEDENCRKISIPTYPFERRKHWFSKVENGSNGKAELNKLHPFIDTNESTFRDFIYRKTFKSTDVFINEHVVNSRKVLPGAVYLELLRAAGELANCTKVTRIKNIRWLSPLIIDSGFYPIDIILNRLDDHLVDFKIVGAKNAVLHCKGQLGFSKNNPDINSPDIDILKEKLARGPSMNGLYDMFKSIGLAYGKSFRTIEGYCSDNECILSKLNVGEKNNTSDIMLNPFLLDGAFQTIACKPGFFNNGRGLYIPYSIQEIEIFDPVNTNCYTYLREIASSNESERKFNMVLISEEGNVLAKINELIIRKVPNEIEPVKNDFLNGGKKEDEVLYYNYQWVKGEINDRDKDTETSFLVFDTQKNVPGYLRPITGNTYNFVFPSTGYGQINEFTYCLDPLDAEQVLKLFSQIDLSGISSLTILYLWGYSSREKNGSRHQKDVLGYSLFGLINIFQSIYKLAPKLKINFLYIYGPDTGSIAYNEAVYCFLKTYSRENQRFSFSHVMTDRKPNPSGIVQIACREFAQSGQSQVKYKAKARFIKKIQQFDPRVTNNNNLLKSQGTYLITGGLGGVGLIVSSYLIEKYNASIVFVGRSKLNKKKQGILNGLKKPGVKIIYKQSDLSGITEIGHIVKDLKSNHIVLNGIFHLAGVLDDSLLVNSKKESVRKIIFPKVTGLKNLDEATKDEPLDLFVCFSSLAAVVGNLGQSGYAYANGFMDSFVGQRNTLVHKNKRSGASVSINWPIWRNGGMAVEGLDEAFLRKQTGLALLDPETGIAILENCLQKDVGTQVIAVQGDKLRIEGILGVASPEKQASSGTLTSGVSIETIKGILKQHITKILKLGENELDEETPFEDYGLDSISTMKFVNAMMNEFDFDINPSLLIDCPTINELAEYLTDNELGHHFVGNNRENTGAQLMTDIKEVQTPLQVPEIGRTNNQSGYYPEIIPRDKLSYDTILLTGSTGILGSYLLRELLLTTDCRFFCQVRAKTGKEGMERIKKAVLGYGTSARIDEELKTDRIIPVIGDITQEYFGLSEKTAREILDSTDIIVHCAASTNLFFPYEQLEATNVRGVKNIVQMGMMTRQKYLLHVSSYSIMGDTIFQDNISYSEKDFDISQHFPKQGYQQSKFEGEKLVRLAAHDGLRWDIVRPGNILGESNSGNYPFNGANGADIYYELFEMVIKNKLSVFGNNYFDITPVDYIAKSIIHIIRGRKTFYETYHLVNPDKKKWYEIINMIINLGYNIQFLPVDEYMSILHSDEIKYRDNPDEQVLVNMLKYNSNEDLYKSNACVDAEYTKKEMEKAGIMCPKIDEGLLRCYLRKYAEMGNIPNPSGKLIPGSYV